MVRNDLDARAQRDIEALVELLNPEDRKILLEMTETELMRLYHGADMVAQSVPSEQIC
jgi:hypothetical protein